MAVKKVSSGKSVNSSRNPKQMSSARIQAALYQIADAASAVTDMQSFYKKLHTIVGKLMYARNFFIALLDEKSNLITWPYHADVKDTDDVWGPQPLADYRGGTAYLLRNGQPVWMKRDYKRMLKSGQFEQTGPTSADFIGIPLKGGNKTLGALVIQSYTSRHTYTKQDVEILSFVAQHISTALTRARAIEETRQRNAELAILNSVGEAMSKTLDVKTVTRIVGDKVRDIFSADQIGILLFEQQANLIHLAYGYDKAHDRYIDSVQIKPIPLGKGLTSKVIESRQPLLLSTREEQDVHGHYLPPELKGKIKTSESWLGVPIMVEENVLGVVMVEDYRPHMYNENHLRLLQTLSSNMGVAIQNARLFDETQQRNAELAIINSVQEGLASKLEIQGIYDLVGDKVRDIFDANAVTLATFELDKNILHLHYAIEKGRRNFIEPMPIPELYMDFIRRGQPLLINTQMAEYIEGIDPGFKQLAGEMPRSVLAVPLTMKGEMFGLITLQNMDRENAFSESDMRLLQTLANSMSVALENARLFDETQQRNAELAIINSVQEGLASKLDMPGIYDLVGDKVRKIFDANTVTLVTFDLDKKILYPQYAFEKGQRLFIEPTPISVIYMDFIRRGQPLLVNNRLVEYFKGIDPGFKPLAGETPMSALAVPLTMNGEMRGLISLQNIDRENAFSESDVRLLQTLANSMSVALENARLFDETQQRNAELAIINSVQEGLASKLEMQEIYDLVGNTLREIFQSQAQTIFFAFYNPLIDLTDFPFLYENGKVRQVVNWRPDIPLARKQIETRETIFIRTVADLEAVGMTAEYARSGIFVPFVQREKLHGIVGVSNQEREFAFSESDVSLLKTITNSMLVALENARLWEQEKMFRKALQRELDIGREIQAGFLPETLPRIEGWEIAASLMSAREVAGDFYDAFELPDGTIGLVIADVCDKGVGAALFMTLFRSLIRAAANLDYFEHTENENSPHSTTERLQRAISLTNNYIAETHGDSGMFATLFFGILDPRDGRLAYINGGHEPPLILHAGAALESLRKTGPAVGAIMNCRFEIMETQIQSNDTFFAFTDGVPDCKNPLGDFFGRERLLDSLRQSKRSAPELVAAIESEMRQYIASANQFDDITLLAVKRMG